MLTTVLHYHLFACFVSSIWLQAESKCVLPETWRGNWFQKGIHPTMEISDDTISTKGRCIDSNLKRLLFLFHDSQLNCVRCLLIFQRHYNVLQYRQTYCFQHGELMDICRRLNSDENLHSMFRADAQPIACPFKGSYSFAYNSGGLAECSYPMSSTERCVDQSQMMFKFQACTDITSTESRDEKLTCLAIWKSSSLTYFVGKMEHAFVTSDNDRYRCFVYEKLKGKDEILRISQSPDATCHGLDHSNAGSRIMKFKKIRDHPSRCRFPEWVTVSHRQWETLDMTQSYVFSQKNKSLYITENTPFDAKTTQNSGEKRKVTKVRCIVEYQMGPSQVTSVVHVNFGCSNGFQCMRIHRRKPHIIQIIKGQITKNKTDACNPANMDRSIRETVTLVETTHTRHSKCPNFLERADKVGKKVETTRRNVTKNAKSKRELCDISSAKISCDSNTVNFHVDCVNPIPAAKYKCHGHWREDGVTYLVSTVHGTNRRICLAYSLHQGKINVSARDNCVSHHSSSNVNMVRTLFSLEAHVTESCQGSANAFVHNSKWLIVSFFYCLLNFFSSILR